MNQKTIITILIAVVLIGGGFILLTKPTQAPAQQAVTKTITSALITETEQYDFGVIDIFGGKVATEFPVTNTGEEAITILDGTTSCACTTAEIAGVDFDMHNGMKKPVIIAPGETKMLLVTYDPLFHGPKGTGKITREVILKTNSSVTPELRAIFKAEVVKS